MDDRSKRKEPLLGGAQQTKKSYKDMLQSNDKPSQYQYQQQPQQQQNHQQQNHQQQNHQQQNHQQQKYQQNHQQQTTTATTATATKQNQQQQTKTSKNNNSKPNHRSPKHPNHQTLVAIFGDSFPEDFLFKTLKKNDFDLDRTLTELCQLAGMDKEKIFSDSEETPFSLPSASEKKQTTTTTTSTQSPSPSSPSPSSPSPSSKLVFEEVVGDLFSSPPQSALAHCVSRDLNMGKGIAVLFKKNFGGVNELQQQNKQIGQVATLKIPVSQQINRFVFYLITKEKYWHKPTYATLTESLVEMKKECLVLGVKMLSMPRIGCGLDGLLWSKVRQLICELFFDVDISIHIYSLTP